MALAFQKTGKSEYAVALPKAMYLTPQTLTIRRNAYTGLWDIWNSFGGVAWAQNIPTLYEAKERIRSRYEWADEE
jgi:hypothetical protein